MLLTLLASPIRKGEFLGNPYFGVGFYKHWDVFFSYCRHAATIANGVYESL